MTVDRAVNIEDLHRLARRRLPRVVFDYVEGGLDDERGLERAERAFDKYSLVPRYLVDVAERDQSASLFGRRYASPFGIAPTGLAGLCRPGADLMLAQAAAAENIPFVMSGASTASIEATARIAPDHAWYQLYGARDAAISEDLIRRSRDAGLGVLMLTVDVPVNSNRERNRRNGFERPYKLPPAILLEALRHPGWIVDYLRHGGLPKFENWRTYAPAGASAREIAEFVATQTPSTQTWRELESYRRLWPRPLVVKGILHPDDAVRARDLGVDGIIVSNHGARQLDRAPAPIEMLPAIAAAVGDTVTVMVDGGIRRGSDIVIAWCLGARYTFLGRATLYGAAAGGLAGAQRAIAILRREVDLVLGQIGCPSLDRLGADCLLSPG
jgi:(S)-mandelate dehydrogenase